MAVDGRAGLKAAREGAATTSSSQINSIHEGDRPRTVRHRHESVARPSTPGARRAAPWTIGAECDQSISSSGSISMSRPSCQVPSGPRSYWRITSTAPTIRPASSMTSRVSSGAARSSVQRGHSASTTPACRQRGDRWSTGGARVPVDRVSTSAAGVPAPWDRTDALIEGDGMVEVALGLVVVAERRGQHPEVIRRGTHADERGIHRDDAVTRMAAAPRTALVGTGVRPPRRAPR